MKKLIFLVIFGFAAWYAWHHWPELTHRMPQHDVEVRNAATTGIVRLRLTVGGQSFVKERLAVNETAVWHFRVDHDSDFDILWEWADRPGEMHWSGGRVTRGPIVERHMLALDDEGGVIYTSREKLAAGPGPGNP